jgi:hypothetical protein
MPDTDEAPKCPVYPNCGSGVDMQSVQSMMEMLAAGFEMQNKELKGIQQNQQDQQELQRTTNTLLERVNKEEKFTAVLEANWKATNQILTDHKNDTRQTLNNLGDLIRTTSANIQAIDSKKMDKAELIRYGVIFIVAQSGVASGIVWLLNVTNVL